MKRFGIEAQPGQGAKDMVESANNDREYEVSYRSGGGIAIAALAHGEHVSRVGRFFQCEYLKAAEDAFDYLEKNNLKLTNDGKENIVDDYCALAAATELYRATQKQGTRLLRTAGQRTSWRARSAPAVIRITGGPTMAASVLSCFGRRIARCELALLCGDRGSGDEAAGSGEVKKSLEFELAITAEVNNPFGYSREYVQDKTGARRTSFFFPHNSDAAPWWQGENARLASVATAARLAARDFPDDADFHAQA